MSRRQYPFHLIEPKWQQHWAAEQTFRAWNPGEAVPDTHPFALRHGLAGKNSAAQLPPKFYILDMFPYPSGAGLHVGHPEGYTATDILARYRRAQGFNVLHPMGWDSFGLPAEQYAVKTGQHPRVTTEANIANFTRQIKSLGFSYDWMRELATTDPDYFKWTQWIFLKLYNSWFNPQSNRAEPIETLTFPEDCTTEEKKREFRDSKRLAYVSEAPVNWCPELGTVLANEEVIDGKSEVGGFPVIRKPMRQWMLRITAYAEKLLADLNTIDWSDSLKEMQRNWIGRSEGAEVVFQISNSESQITVFTTRPDTLFGATYMVLSPEHKLVGEITTVEQKQAVEDYKAFAAGKSDLERTELAKEKSGVFTGAYAINPVNGENIPIWIADYVLASYGTGAIMAVPAHDTRDFEFAKKFNLRIVPVVIPPEEWLRKYLIPSFKDEPLQELHRMWSEGAIDANNGVLSEAFEFKRPEYCDDGTATNSSNNDISLDGLPTPEATQKITAWLEEKGLGKRTINYKLRDWLFSRQRYWGEPFPIVWKKDAAGNLYHEAVPEKSLPVLPPMLTDYKPTSDGQPPLARATDWVHLKSGAMRETNTMPQWAGSCWYYLRYLDAKNSRRFVSRETECYWMGSEMPAGARRCLSREEWKRELADLEAVAFTDMTKQTPRSVQFSQVSPDLAAQVLAVTGEDVSDYWHSLDALHLLHLSKHSNVFLETRRGNLPLTEDDLLNLPEVLATPDSVEYSRVTPDGFKRLVITKRVNGTVFVVEEIRGRTQQLQVITFWKKKATAKDVITKMPLSCTPESDRRCASNKAPAAPAVKPTPGVDLYVGGTEHAVLHLLYARFWHKVLFDLGHVSTAEPFFKLVNQGLILGEDGQKMSKSRGNTVNPDDVLAEFGADAFRLYEMFMGPLQDTKPWNTRGVEGVYRFLGRVWRLFVDEKSETEFEQAETVSPVGQSCRSASESGEAERQLCPTTEAERQLCPTGEMHRHAGLLKLIQLNPAIKDIAATPAQLKTLHTCIKKVTEDLDGLRFNTAISAMMVFINDAMTWETKPCCVLREFLQLLAPFAPHVAEELWAKLSTFNLQPSTLSLTYAPWPKFDPALLVESELEIPVSVNGKLRDVIKVSATATQAEMEAAALANDKIKAALVGKTVKKVIVVPKKMVNIVVG